MVQKKKKILALVTSPTTADPPPAPAKERTESIANKAGLFLSKPNGIIDDDDFNVIEGKKDENYGNHNHHNKFIQCVNIEPLTNNKSMRHH